MSSLGTPARRYNSIGLGATLPAGIAFTIFVAAAALYAGRLVANDSQFVHPLLALLVAGTLGLLAMTSPRTSIVATLLMLPFLAFGRRLLILYDGWHSQEPLLLVGPAIAMLLVLHY